MKQKEKLLGLLEGLLLAGMLVSLFALSGCNANLPKGGTQPGTQSGEEPEEPTDEAKARATYQWIQSNIFEKSCVGCHNSELSKGGVSLSSYEDTIASEILIPGSPEESILYNEVESGSMPKKSPALPDEQIKAIKDWILQGAQNN